MLKQKSEAFQAFLNFKSQAKLQLDHRIKVVQIDYVLSNGSIHRTSCPYIHEQNEIVEHKHRRIVEHGLTLRAQASLPLKY